MKKSLAALSLSSGGLLAHAILLALASRHPSFEVLAALVVARLFAIVIVPGVVLAAIVLALAHLVRQRDGSSSGAGISVGDDDGASIGVRGAE